MSSQARDVVRGRVVEPEEALVGEHPHGGGGDDLGEREPEVGRLRCCRCSGGEVAMAVGAGEGRAAGVEIAIEAPGIASRSTNSSMSRRRLGELVGARG